MNSVDKLSLYSRCLTKLYIFYLSLTVCSGDKFTIAVRSVSLYDNIGDNFFMAMVKSTRI